MRALVWLLTACSLMADSPIWHQAVPGYRFQFPRDHFDHPGFRTEWWYYTGNVRSGDGHRYGFQLVFFRQGERRGPSDNASAWRVDDLYLAHLALTDIDGGRHRYYKRLNRAGPGIAGVSFEQGLIWNGNWRSQWDKTTGAQTLTAIAEDIRFELRLAPRKPPVLEGENGLSRKAEGTGHASYYISFPRLSVEGELNGVSVAGTAWMDHEWFTNQLAPDQAGWDWFSIQLENGADLMLFQLRHRDGSVDPYSSGTYIDGMGRSRHLGSAEFTLQPLEFWKSPHTGARYPLRWRMTIPSLQITLECAAALADQELISDDAVGPTYWEGAVTYTGSANGVGYLELTGYTKPMRL